MQKKELHFSLLAAISAITFVGGCASGRFSDESAPIATAPAASESGGLGSAYAPPSQPTHATVGYDAASVYPPAPTASGAGLLPSQQAQPSYPGAPASGQYSASQMNYFNRPASAPSYRSQPGSSSSRGCSVG